MAVARNVPSCFKCGKHMKGVYRKAPRNFVGDNFIRWDHDGPCESETEEYKELKAKASIDDEDIEKILKEINES